MAMPAAVTVEEM
jgi:hypothetical protein